MKRFFAILLNIIFFLTSINLTVYAQTEPVSIIVEYKTENQTLREDIQKNSFGKKANRIKRINKKLDSIEFSNASAAYNAISKLNSDPNVSFAEIDQKRELMGVNPNDALFSYQWGHNFVEATTAWEAVSYQQGNPIVVAVIDTGVDSNHPDLAGKVISGYNAVNGSTNTTDVNGHGTFVSGIVAASSNNGIGVSGVTGKFDVVVMPIKVLNDSTGLILSSYLISAVEYAITMNVDVINMSLGGTNYSTLERNAMKNAKNAGITLVASSGNNHNTTINYPASYEDVISVASHTSDGSRSEFSNYNAYVDITAPGSNITSTSKNNTYASSNGTSFSSPYVAGIAAMIIAVAPSKTPEQVTNILTSSAVKPSGQSGRSDQFGHGYANAPAALRLALNLDFSATSISLSYDKVYLGSGISSFIIDAVPSPSYNGNLVWYKNTDTEITTGNSSFLLESGASHQGSVIVTAKIPLYDSASCEFSWTNTYSIASIEESFTGVSITGGTLLGEFDPNKTEYKTNVNNTDIMPIVIPQTANNITHFIKNANHLDDSTVITISDSYGNTKSYSFKATVLTGNVYPYMFTDGTTSTFAVATYKNTGANFTLYMICAEYDSSTNKLKRSEVIEVNVLNGYYTYKTSFEIEDENFVKVMLLEDLFNIKPYENVMVYP